MCFPMLVAKESLKIDLHDFLINLIKTAIRRSRLGSLTLLIECIVVSHGHAKSFAHTVSTEFCAVLFNRVP